MFNATSGHSLTVSCKSASHALMDVSAVRPATTALNADLITFSIQELHCVWKSVVMAKNTLQTVMMETMSMGMDAARTVTLKLDSHATVVHQAPKMPVQPFFHQLL